MRLAALGLLVLLAALASRCGGSSTSGTGADASIDATGAGRGSGASNGASAGSASGGSTGASSRSGGISGGSSGSPSSGSGATAGASSTGSSGSSSGSGATAGASTGSSGSSASGSAGSGSSTSGGGGTSGSSGVACSPSCAGTGLTCCNGKCVNLDNDPVDCGACGVTCGGTTPFCERSCIATPCYQDAGACTGTSCCGTQCCNAGDICCLAETGTVNFPKCYTPPTEQPSCPIGCLSCVSDRNLKRDIEPVDEEAVLEALARLSVSTWSYKSDPAAVRHMGPMAQDFKGAFGLGDSDKSYNAIDAHGVAFAAIQAMYRRLQEQDARIALSNQPGAGRRGCLRLMRSASARRAALVRASNHRGYRGRRAGSRRDRDAGRCHQHGDAIEQQYDLFLSAKAGLREGTTTGTAWSSFAAF